MDAIRVEFIRRWCLAESWGEVLTLEAFLADHPDAVTGEFVDWWCEFISRQARRERRR